MASRRWLDWDIVVKIGVGALMVGAPLFTWFGLGFITRGLWVIGVLGLFVFCWGLFAIGDSRSEWER